MVLHGISMRKNATKSSKIRALAQLASVKAECKQETLDRIEAILLSAEESRAKKKKANTKDTTENPDEEDDQDEANTL